jgi:ApaG protein
MSDEPTRSTTPATGPDAAAADGGPWGSDTTTRGIRVQVRSAYLPEQSAPSEQQYFFTYHVRISNAGPDAAQLVSREWVITDAEGQVERVKGPGVIGQEGIRRVLGKVWTTRPGIGSMSSSSCGTSMWIS